MDIWKKMYEEARNLYNPHEVSDFVYANHVVAAVEAEDGQIFTGFCMEGTCGVFHLCAERAALFNMYQFSGQTKVKKILAFRDKPPYGEGLGMPCGACREFLLELNAENKEAEFMMDYETRKTITGEKTISFDNIDSFLEDNATSLEQIAKMSESIDLLEKEYDTNFWEAKAAIFEYIFKETKRRAEEKKIYKSSITIISKTIVIILLSQCYSSFIIKSQI